MRGLLRFWPNKSREQMVMLAIELGGGGILALYLFGRRVALGQGMDDAAWVLLIGGLVLLALLVLSWRDYQSKTRSGRYRTR
jgi:hypothetical protein